jgi:nicotinamidase-related amidase
MVGVMTRALVVIDVQESFRRQPLWPASSNPGIADDVARLVDGVRANMDPLVPLAGEPQLTKTSHNAFTTTNLQQLLTQQGVSEVIVCGIRTEQCCETTARVAFDLGYQVTFVTEATATGPIGHRDAPAGRSVDEVLAAPGRCRPGRSSSGRSTRSRHAAAPQPSR